MERREGGTRRKIKREGRSWVQVPGDVFPSRSVVVFPMCRASLLSHPQTNNPILNHYPTTDPKSDMGGITSAFGRDEEWTLGDKSDKHQAGECSDEYKG